jgi:O-antigen/teichoic acid export membrane protein
VASSSTAAAAAPVPSAWRRAFWRLRGGITGRADYVATFATEFLVMASMLLVYRLAATSWPGESFSEYALARRTLGLMQLPLLVGGGISIPRYMAMASASGSALAAAPYFTAGLTLGLSVTLAALAALNGLAPWAAAMLFGSSHYAYLIGALSIAALGLSLHVLSYSYFRGRRRMISANALQLVNLGVVPPTLFLVPGLSVAGFITLLGLGWVAVALVVLVPVLGRLGPEAWRGPVLRTSGMELLRFGLVRVPGEFALAALLVLPATIATHVGGVTAGGSVAFSITLLSAVGSAFAPIGLVLLPRASALVARGEAARLRRILAKLLAAAFLISGLGVVGFELLGPWALRLYLGADLAAQLWIARLVFLGVIPYVAYVVLRNALDALHVKPYNTKNLLLALGVLAAAAGVGRTVVAAVVGLVGGLFLLGGLSLLDTMRLLRGRVPESPS